MEDDPENLNQSLYSEENAEENSSDYEESSDSSDEDDGRNEIIGDKEIIKLRQWAIDCKILRVHLAKLLEILSARLLPSLPKSSKTFLGTNDADYKIEEMEDSEGGIGSFLYFGLERGLRDCVNKNLHKDGVIELQAHADAIPVTKSGTDNFWVLSAKVHFDPDIYKPFRIAIFLGQNKPKTAQIFLDRFINEINQFQRGGIEISGKKFELRLNCIVADTPARAFLKNILGHGGTYACERCPIEGEKVNSITVYPSTDATERSDASFRNFEQTEHHHGPSPFLRIFPLINMVAFFVLDFMHLCCQGIMKKLIEYWVSGDLNFKLSSRSKLELSNRLIYIRSQIPREFQRKTRSLKTCAKLKVTELRFCLLYSGLIVLKGLVREDLYKYFLLFHAACRILSSRNICLQYANEEKQYLITFFIAMKDFYVPKSQILNAHHLMHLADDLKFIKCCLSSITAFPFENLLGKIQKYLRTAYRPLAQICRRLYEESLLEKKKPVLPLLVEVIKVSGNNIKEIQYKQMIISTSTPNNSVILNDDTIVKVTKIFGKKKHYVAGMLH